jgi:glycosyltransferase involved in cell wall biosynthesis
MLVAFSHLRWDFVWQRPQHVLSRLSREMPVLFVEEPAGDASKDMLELRLDGRVTIARAHLHDMPARSYCNDAVNKRVASLLEPLLTDDEDLVTWYYTPMAIGAFPESITPVLTVYDAMDDLASFRNAPPEMRAQEARMLEMADIVFTGGPTLYRQRQHRHPRVYCFPSGVDRAHFASPGLASSASRALSQMRRPVIGFYGVIDERMDMDLVARIADLRPDWNFVLVGPLAKIRAEDLPSRTNIRRYGMQAYESLPAILARFDVAMMPFALNEATRAISPTKTLEFLAGGKPVVSTPVADVIELYGAATSIAGTPDDFVAAIDEILAWSPEDRAAWQQRADTLLAAHDWNQIVEEMAAAMNMHRFAPLSMTA